LTPFGLESIEPGCRIADRAPYLEGMLPLDGESGALFDVELEAGRHVDVHLLPDAAGDWVILLDRSAESQWRGVARQKSNELSLLRRHVANPETDADYPAGFGICDLLNIMALEWNDDGTFHLLTPLPPELHPLIPKAESDSGILHLEQRFPFLENFLVDAKETWSCSAGRIKSGPWIETDSAGKEYALEATAACWQSRKILLIALLGDTYREHHSLLQRGREDVLVKEYLEQVVRRRTEEIRQREEEIALRLVWAAESRVGWESDSHIRRIGLYSEALALALGWEREQTDELRLAATMHDIGKIGIPDNILRKSSRLTPDEFEIMKTHTLIGGRILEGSESSLLRMARDIALCHHEQWDGAGYPRGMAGEEIPVSARIVAVADVFDALISGRDYRRGVSVEEAVSVMQAERGSRFDPELFEVFVSVLPEFRDIADSYAEGPFNRTGHKSRAPLKS